MCGIVGLHLRNPELYPRLGELLTGMLCEMGDRGSDSAGVAVYGDPTWSPPGQGCVSRASTPAPTRLAEEVIGRGGVRGDRRSTVDGVAVEGSYLLSAAVDSETLLAAVRGLPAGADRRFRFGHGGSQGGRPSAGAHRRLGARQGRRAGRGSATPGWPPSPP